MLLGGRSAHPGGWAGVHPHVLSRVLVHPPGPRHPDLSTNVGGCQGRPGLIPIRAVCAARFWHWTQKL